MQASSSSNGVSELTSHLSSASLTHKSETPAAGAGGQQPITQNPAKKLRNLKKKLRDIEALEAKINSKEVQPEPEQLEKVARKGEVMREIADFEKQVLAYNGVE